jgi:UDP-N-acetylmuramate dehydrogenase
MTDLAAFTTLGVGGPARRLVEASDRETLITEARDAFRDDEPLLVLGGGSNVVVSDDGFDGTVIVVRTRGIVRHEVEGDVLLDVEAGVVWDELVAHTVDQSLTGIEALSGIPGSVGASPVQNIGAYGQEISESIESIEFLDAITREVVTLTAEELGFGYRTSELKRGREGVVLAVRLRLRRSATGRALYPQLAAALGVELGAEVPLPVIREQVLALRASKGMVLAAGDPDTASCGSFYTNPIVPAVAAASLPDDAPRWPIGEQPADLVLPIGAEVPVRASQPALVKLSAAWLIERAGIPKGFALPGSRAGISSKHTLALTNRGGATAADVAELSRYVRTRVLSEFGVSLAPEPVAVDVEL